MVDSRHRAVVERRKMLQAGRPVYPFCRSFYFPNFYCIDWLCHLQSQLRRSSDAQMHCDEKPNLLDMFRVPLNNHSIRSYGQDVVFLLVWTNCHMSKWKGNILLRGSHSPTTRRIIPGLVMSCRFLRKYATRFSSSSGIEKTTKKKLSRNVNSDEEKCFWSRIFPVWVEKTTTHTHTQTTRFCGSVKSKPSLHIRHKWDEQ